MSPLDAMFLYVEDGISHMHVGSCAIFEGPAPPYGDVLRLIESKLALIPRYRQKVRFVPGDVGRPVWVDDPHFNLEYHVRHTALPDPGSDLELNILVGRVMSQELDRHRPLWEAWMVEGLAEGRWALVSKVHHCMVDGVSGTELLTVLLDPRPDAPVITNIAKWEPAAEPSDAALIIDSIGLVAGSGTERRRAVRSLLRTPRQVAGQVTDALRAIVHAGTELTPQAGPSIDRRDRSAPPLGVGARPSGGCAGDQGRPGRHGQRRRAHRHRRRVPRPAAVEIGGPGRCHPPHAGAGLRACRRRPGAEQPGGGDGGHAPDRDRRSCGPARCDVGTRWSG